MIPVKSSIQPKMNKPGFSINKSGSPKSADKVAQKKPSGSEESKVKVIEDEETQNEKQTKAIADRKGRAGEEEENKQKKAGDEEDGEEKENSKTAAAKVTANPLGKRKPLGGIGGLNNSFKRKKL